MKCCLESIKLVEEAEKLTLNLQRGQRAYKWVILLMLILVSSLFAAFYVQWHKIRETLLICLAIGSLCPLNYLSLKRNLKKMVRYRSVIELQDDFIEARNGGGELLKRLSYREIGSAEVKGVLGLIHHGAGRYDYNEYVKCSSYACIREKARYGKVSISTSMIKMGT